MFRFRKTLRAILLIVHPKPQVQFPTSEAGPCCRARTKHSSAYKSARFSQSSPFSPPVLSYTPSPVSPGRPRHCTVSIAAPDTPTPSCRARGASCSPSSLDSPSPLSSKVSRRGSTPCGKTGPSNCLLRRSPTVRELHSVDVPCPPRPSFELSPILEDMTNNETFFTCQSSHVSHELSSTEGFSEYVSAVGPGVVHQCLADESGFQSDSQVEDTTSYCRDYLSVLSEVHPDLGERRTTDADAGYIPSLTLTVPTPEFAICPVFRPSALPDLPRISGAGDFPAAFLAVPRASHLPGCPVCARENNQTPSPGRIRGDRLGALLGLECLGIRTESTWVGSPDAGTDLTSSGMGIVDHQVQAAMSGDGIGGRHHNSAAGIRHYIPRLWRRGWAVFPRLG